MLILRRAFRWKTNMKIVILGALMTCTDASLFGLFGPYGGKNCCCCCCPDLFGLNLFGDCCNGGSSCCASGSKGRDNCRHGRSADKCLFGCSDNVFGSDPLGFTDVGYGNPFGNGFGAGIPLFENGGLFGQIPNSFENDGYDALMPPQPIMNVEQLIDGDLFNLPFGGYGYDGPATTTTMGKLNPPYLTDYDFSACPDPGVTGCSKGCPSGKSGCSGDQRYDLKQSNLMEENGSEASSGVIVPQMPPPSEASVSLQKPVESVWHNPGNPADVYTPLVTDLSLGLPEREHAAEFSLLSPPGGESNCKGAQCTGDWANVFTHSTVSKRPESSLECCPPCSILGLANGETVTISDASLTPENCDPEKCPPCAFPDSVDALLGAVIDGPNQQMVQYAERILEFMECESGKAKNGTKCVRSVQDLIDSKANANMTDKFGVLHEIQESVTSSSNVSVDEQKQLSGHQGERPISPTGAHSVNNKVIVTEFREKNVEFIERSALNSTGPAEQKSDLDLSPADIYRHTTIRQPHNNSTPQLDSQEDYDDSGQDSISEEDIEDTQMYASYRPTYLEWSEYAQYTRGPSRQFQQVNDVHVQNKESTEETSNSLTPGQPDDGATLRLSFERNSEITDVRQSPSKKSGPATEILQKQSQPETFMSSHSQQRQNGVRAQTLSQPDQLDNQLHAIAMRPEEISVVEDQDLTMSVPRLALPQQSARNTTSYQLLQQLYQSNTFSPLPSQPQLEVNDRSASYAKRQGQHSLATTYAQTEQKSQQEVHHAQIRPERQQLLSPTTEPQHTRGQVNLTSESRKMSRLALPTTIPAKDIPQQTLKKTDSLKNLRELHSALTYRSRRTNTESRNVNGTQFLRSTSLIPPSPMLHGIYVYLSPETLRAGSQGVLQAVDQRLVQAVSAPQSLTIPPPPPPPPFTVNSAQDLNINENNRSNQKFNEHNNSAASRNSYQDSVPILIRALAPNLFAVKLNGVNSAAEYEFPIPAIAPTGRSAIVDGEVRSGKKLSSSATFGSDRKMLSNKREIKAEERVEPKSFTRDEKFSRKHLFSYQNITGNASEEKVKTTSLQLNQRTDSVAAVDGNKGVEIVSQRPATLAPNEYSHIDRVQYTTSISDQKQRRNRKEVTRPAIRQLFRPGNQQGETAEDQQIQRKSDQQVLKNEVESGGTKPFLQQATRMVYQKATPTVNVPQKSLRSVETQALARTGNEQMRQVVNQRMENSRKNEVAQFRNTTVAESDNPDLLIYGENGSGRKELRMSENPEVENIHPQKHNATDMRVTKETSGSQKTSDTLMKDVNKKEPKELTGNKVENDTSVDRGGEEIRTATFDNDEDYSESYEDGAKDKSQTGDEPSLQKVEDEIASSAKTSQLKSGENTQLNLYGADVKHHGNYLSRLKNERSDLKPSFLTDKNFKKV